MSTELTLVERAVAALGKQGHDKELIAMAARSVSIKAITNPDGYKQVHAARVALKNERVELQKLGKAARDDATKFSKAVIAEENRLIGLILPEEQRLERLQQDHDDAIEAAKQAAISAEEKRVADLRQRVSELTGALGVAKRYNLSAGEFAEHIADLERVPVDESFQEFREEAEAAKAATLTSLRQMHSTAEAREQEAARLKAEREELDRQRAAQKKLDDEAKALRDAEIAKQNDELRKQREAQQAEAARVKAEQDAEAKRLAAERTELARQQEAIRKAQEPPPAPPTPPPAPVSRRGVAVPVPTAAEIIEVLSKHYRARPDTVIDWLRAVDWRKAEAA
jgi:hypothetical protein